MNDRDVLLVAAALLLLFVWRQGRRPPAIPTVSTSSQWYDYTTGTWRDVE